MNQVIGTCTGKKAEQQHATVAPTPGFHRGRSAFLGPELMAFVFAALSDPSTVKATQALRLSCRAGVEGFDIAGCRGLTHLAASFDNGGDDDAEDAEDGGVASFAAAQRQWFPATYQSSKQLPSGDELNGGGLGALVKLEAARYLDEQPLTLAQRLRAAWNAPHLVVCFPPTHAFTTTQLEAIETCAPCALTVHAPAPMDAVCGDRVLRLDMSAASVKQRLHTVDLGGCDEFNAIAGGIATSAAALKHVVLPAKLSMPPVIEGAFLCDAAALKSIDLAGLTGITKLDDDFLRGCSALRSIDLAPLATVRSIGSRFLSGCASIVEVNVSVMTALETAMSHFMHKCLALEQLDMCCPSLTSLGPQLLSENGALVSVRIRCRQLKHLGKHPFAYCEGLRDLAVVCDDASPELAVPSGFAMSCRCLTAVDLSAFRQAVDVGQHFISGSTELRSIDLTALSAATRVDYSCLYGAGITEVDLSPLRNVRTFSGGLLCACPKLTRVDLSPLSQLQAIADSSLGDCHALTGVSLGGLSAVTAVGSFVLASTLRLEALDLRPLANVAEIGSFLCRDCTALSEINVTGLSKLTRIDDSFCSGATALENVVGMSTLTALEAIGNRMFYGCAKLVTVELHGLFSLCSIGSHFVANCPSLTLLSIRSCPNLTTIGQSFARDCRGLRTADLRGLSAVETLPACFLAGCTSLKRLDMRPMTALASIGSDALAGCVELECVNCSGLSDVHDVSSAAFRRCPSDAFVFEGVAAPLAAVLRALKRDGAK